MRKVVRSGAWFRTGLQLSLGPAGLFCGLSLRESTPFRGAKGDDTRAPAYVTREARHLNQTRSRSMLLALTLVGFAWANRATAQSEAPIAPLAPEPPPAASQTARLRPGETVTLRVRQVIPCDGLTAGVRLLNGRPAIAPGDRVVAEDVRPGVHPAALIGGTIVQIAPPKRFAKPGRVTLELRQLMQAAPGRSELVPWVFDLEDRRFNVEMRRRLTLALFAAEGAGIGASLGAQAGPSSPAYLGLGAGVGLLTGIGYASLMPGREASLEPGDTFKITVGTLSYRPLAPSPPLSLYPAPDPAKRTKEHGR